MKTIMIALAAVGLLAGCARHGAEDARAVAAAPMMDPMSPLMAPGFMAAAASSDQFEIQSSQMALQMSRNPQVRQFAQTMIDHHSRTTAELTQIAQANGMAPPPPVLMPAQQAALDRIRAAGPDGFEAAYKQEQIAGHSETLSTMRNYEAQGDNPALRGFASRTAPVVQQHLSMAQMLPDQAMMQQPAPSRAGERG